jgi:hypothetical protein
MEMSSWMRRFVHAVTGLGYRPLVDDVEAYLAGRYVSHVERSGLPIPVPMWAWLNAPAHATRADLADICFDADQVLHRFFFGWRECRSVIAAELLDITVGNDALLRRLQTDVLQAAESELSDGADHSPVTTARDVLTAMRGYVAARGAT